MYPRQPPLPTITQVAILDFCLYPLILVVSMIVFIPMQEVILGVMTEDVEVVLNKSSTLTYKMMDKVLVVMGEVDIGLIPAPRPPPPPPSFR